MKNIVIQLTNISKKYEIHHEKPTLVEKFVQGPNETFWALKDINLVVRKGERVGIIGLNGSGKTTLLKIVSGITHPTSGVVKTYGKVVSLIDLEAGFHPDLTGVQNIYLNGMLLGMSQKEITQKLNAIIRFADIRQFIDTALFRYSFGMKLRLGFAIAAHANPTILIIDEGMAVGDSKFQQKCIKKMNQLFAKGTTILLVSQQLDYLRTMCTSLIRMQDGKIYPDTF